MEWDTWSTFSISMMPAHLPDPLSYFYLFHPYAIVTTVSPLHQRRVSRKWGKPEKKIVLAWLDYYDLMLVFSGYGIARAELHTAQFPHGSYTLQLTFFYLPVPTFCPSTCTHSFLLLWSVHSGRPSSGKGPSYSFHPATFSGIHLAHRNSHPCHSS